MSNKIERGLQKRCKKKKTQIFMSPSFIGGGGGCDVYEVTRKNTAKPDRPQMTTRRTAHCTLDT